MEIKRPKKDEVDTSETDVLPDEGDVVDEKPSRERELELEAAELRGELKARKSMAPTSSPQMTIEQTKQAVFGDINNLSDEDFQKKYPGHTKHSASMTVMNESEKQTKAEARQLHAESTAIARLSSKYGNAYYDLEDKLREGMDDLSPEARQDPVKLSRYLERQFLALSRDSAKKTSKPDDRRKVVQDFEKPTPTAQKSDTPPLEIDEDIKDETPEGSDISNQKLAHFMGIRTEKERKQFADKNLVYVDMDLTGKDPYAANEKIRFGDPKRGFERVKSA